MALGGPKVVPRSAADARVRSARLRHMSHNERTPGPAPGLASAGAARRTGGPEQPSWSRPGVADPEAARRPDRFWRLVLRDEARRDGGGQRREMLPPIPPSRHPRGRVFAWSEL